MITLPCWLSPFEGANGFLTHSDDQSEDILAYPSIIPADEIQILYALAAFCFEHFQSTFPLECLLLKNICFVIDCYSQQCLASDCNLGVH